jgi:aspartate/methionine/tyrosine aminotransferase
VKFLLLCNPNNPLGTIYREDVIANAIKWARKRSLHTIVDEIYALSTLKKDNHGFKSVVRVLENNLGNDVHMLWALSKDFGASGFRVGILYSQNQDFLEALGNLSIFSGVSQPIQMAVAEMLTDDQWVDGFLETARARLSASYEICLAKLEEMVVPFIPAEAGIFIYIDLSSLLPEKTFEGEARLSDIMVQYARIVLTPGESQRERTPGMFRICYAWVSPDVLEIAMERLSRLVGKIRKLDWDDLNENTLQSIVQ